MGDRLDVLVQGTLLLPSAGPIGMGAVDRLLWDPEGLCWGGEPLEGRRMLELRGSWGLDHCSKDGELAAARIDGDAGLRLEWASLPSGQHRHSLAPPDTSHPSAPGDPGQPALDAETIRYLHSTLGALPVPLLASLTRTFRLHFQVPDDAVTIADRINQKCHQDWIEAFLAHHQGSAK